MPAALALYPLVRYCFAFPRRHATYLAKLEPKYFAEGCTKINSTIYQLTWVEGDMLLYNDHTFQRIAVKDLPSGINEGWGMTTDGSVLYISDGSSYIYFVDPISFSVIKKIRVGNDGNYWNNINELEYVDGYIYANVYLSNTVLKIDTRNGEIMKEYNMKKLAVINNEEYHGEYHDPGDVLNGIAYNWVTKTWLVTGKRWNFVFEVTFQ